MIDDPTRFDGVTAIGVDEHLWRHTRRGDKYLTVMDPFHLACLAGDALDDARRRVQQDTRGHRGRKSDPLYTARRTLHTGANLLTEKQTQRLDALFEGDTHVQVEVTWAAYQAMVTAYREPDKTRGKAKTRQVIGLPHHRGSPPH